MIFPRGYKLRIINFIPPPTSFDSVIGHEKHYRFGSKEDQDFAARRLSRYDSG